MIDYAPIARIILRYIAGAGFMGSAAIGDMLAADPDLVMIGSLAIGAVVEALYAWSKRTGKPT